MKEVRSSNCSAAATAFLIIKSPFSPTRLADGLGPGLALFMNPKTPGSMITRPKYWFPRASFAETSAKYLYLNVTGLGLAKQTAKEALSRLFQDELI